MRGLTPLQLNLVGPKPYIEVIRLLFIYEANQKVREKSTNNNILHLACLCNDNKVLEFVAFYATELDLNETNDAGDTPLAICRKNKN